MKIQGSRVRAMSFKEFEAHHNSTHRFPPSVVTCGHQAPHRSNGRGSECWGVALLGSHCSHYPADTVKRQSDAIKRCDVKVSRCTVCTAHAPVSGANSNSSGEDDAIGVASKRAALQFSWYPAGSWHDSGDKRKVSFCRGVGSCCEAAALWLQSASCTPQQKIT